MANTMHSQAHKRLTPGKLYRLSGGMCSYKNNKIIYLKDGDLIFIVNLYNLKFQNVPGYELNLTVNLVCKFGQCASYYNDVNSLYYHALCTMELIS